MLFSEVNFSQELVGYKSMEFGIGETIAKGQNGGANLGASVQGTKLIPRFAHQIGFKTTFPIFGGKSDNYSFIHMNIGGGSNTRFFLVTGFVGPSLVYNSLSYEKGKMGLGFNMNVRFVIKPLDGIGFGFESFCNFSTVKNAYGYALIINLSNGTSSADKK